MRRLKIFLADLTHKNIVTASENIPSNIGLLAAYSLKKFGDAVEFRLFKYPEKFIQALNEEEPDILGVSNYVWNSNLSEWANVKAKAKYPNVLTVKGGWTFPLDAEERLKFLLKNPATDLYLIHEAEESFSQVVERCLAVKKNDIFENPIPGSAFVRRNGPIPELVEGEEGKRMKDLDEIPSPFSTGLLDEFFDGKLFPVIETTRGCPFACNFCNSAEKYYSPVRRFSADYVTEELEYIAKKIKKTGGGILCIADTNFGMYSADMAVSQKLAELKDTINWPQSIILTTGKEKIDKVFETIEPLKDILVPSMAAQSMDLATLQAIDRTNLAEKSYKKYANDATDKDLALFAELILSMPMETLETYWTGVKKLIMMGVNKLSTYTLQLNYGTVYRVSSYLKEHDYIGKYRMIPNAYGMYDGDRVFDVEMVGVANKYMSFEEYLEARKLALYIELVYNSDCFSELLKYWRECGFNTDHYLEAIREGFNSAPENIQKIVNSFVKDTKLELFDTEEDLIAYFSTPEIYEKLSRGEIGGNVIFKHKVMMYSQHADELVSFVISCTKSFLKKSSTYNYSDKDEDMLNNLEHYLQSKYSGILDANAIHNTVNFEGTYDIWAWAKDKDGPPLKSFKKHIFYNMNYSREQKQMLEDMFGIYGNNIIGRIKVVSKVMKWQNLVHFPLSNGTS